tara:strand:- start:563 stop:886 length:324 start_codon:yes stop_codon:yes gene_type:complete
MTKYFKEVEYRMDAEFLEKLDAAREFAGFPFFINSAWRSADHPESVKNPTSSHIKGLAVDIRAKDSRTRYLIIDALMHVGFNRIGIADTFIHVDDDKDKSCGVIWTY